MIQINKQLANSKLLKPQVKLPSDGEISAYPIIFPEKTQDYISKGSNLTELFRVSCTCTNQAQQILTISQVLTFHDDIIYDICLFLHFILKLQFKKSQFPV